VKLPKNLPKEHFISRKVPLLFFLILFFLSFALVINLLLRAHSLTIKVDNLTFENGILSSELNDKSCQSLATTDTKKQEDSESLKDQRATNSNYSISLENGKIWLQLPEALGNRKIIVEEPEKEIVKFQMTSDFAHIFYLAKKESEQSLYRYDILSKNRILVANSQVDKFLISPNEKYVAYDKHIKVAPFSCCGNPETEDTRPWAHVMPIDGGVEIKVRSPYIDESFEIDGNKIGKDFGEHYFPCVWDGFTREGNFVIFAAGILDTPEIPFSIDFQGNPLKKLTDSEILPVNRL